MRHLIPLLNTLKNGYIYPKYGFISFFKGFNFQLKRLISESGSNRVQFLANLLGVSNCQASKLLCQNQVLRQLSETRLEKIFKILREMKIDLNQIFHSPQVFNYLPTTLDERINCLKELGFSEVSVSNILKFNTLMRCNMKCLKLKKLLPNDVDCIQEIANKTNDPCYLLDLIMKNHGDLSHHSLGRIRHIVLIEYLAWILRISTDESKVILEKYPSMRNRSLQSIIKTYTVLVRDLDFSAVKIFSHVHLLTKPVDEIQAKLNEFILLAGVGFKYLATKHPKLLNIPTQQLRLVLKLLSSNDVNNDQIVNCSKILLLPAGTIRKRIENLKTVPDFEKYRSHPLFLELVCCKPQEIPEWMKQFESENEANFTNSNFRHVEYFYSSTKHIEVILYVTDYLGLPYSVVEERLQSYPQWVWANLLNTSQVLSLLKQKGLSKEQITIGLPVVLYNEKIVENYLDKVIKGELKENISSPLVLQHVLNAMEEENFLSDGHVIEYHSEKLTSKSKLANLNNNFLTKLFNKYYTSEKQE